MLKKILIILVTVNFLQSCGFAPMYSTGKFTKINIENISLSGDWELGNYIKASLSRYSSNTDSKKYNIDINSNYTENVISRDSTGTPTNYKFNIEVEINLTSENINQNYLFKESFIMENFADKLTKQNYERSNKINIANIIINKFMIQFSRAE